MLGIVFFFNDTATTEIYTLSLHDALPIFGPVKKSHPTGQVSATQPFDFPIAPLAIARAYASIDASPRLQPNLQRLMGRSEEHTSELQSPDHLVCRRLLEQKQR